MKLQFEVNVEKKTIHLYFQKQRFEDWIKPRLTEGYSVKKLSKMVTLVIAHAVDDVAKVTKLDLLNFTPEFTMYIKESELPEELQEIELSGT